LLLKGGKIKAQGLLYKFKSLMKLKNL